MHIHTHALLFWFVSPAQMLSWFSVGIAVYPRRFSLLLVFAALLGPAFADLSGTQEFLNAIYQQNWYPPPRIPTTTPPPPPVAFLRHV